MEEEEFVNENDASAVAAANVSISHDSLQDNPGTSRNYSMSDLVEVYSNSDDRNDDDNTDVTKIAGVPVSNQP